MLGGIIGFGLILFGFVSRAKEKAFAKQYITSIYFHNPKKYLFEKCIRWLFENDYVFISSIQLVEIIQGRLAAPRGAVWISFDDGWKENIDNVVPVITKYDIPATFFISTEPVENSGLFWFSLIKRFSSFFPGEYKDNAKKIWMIKENKRKEIVEDLVRKVSQSVNRQAMTIREVQELSRLPQVTIGSHTVHHVITYNCTPDEFEGEIMESKRILENWINKSVSHFSYPKGCFDGREYEILKNNGFVLAVTNEPRLISIDDDPYLIPRSCIMDDGFFSESICHIVGIWHPFITKVKSFLKLEILKGRHNFNRNPE
jgi:peptidoglycan/xylan/chitin deacetylase (PgdA/CDA1 family)